MVTETVEDGAINLSNGNLHKEIQIAASPQRGSVKYSAALLYDSRIWQIVNNAWQPTNVANSQGGWRFATSVDPGAVTETSVTQTCSSTQPNQIYENFVWTQSNGTQVFFPITTSQNTCTSTNVTSGDAYATDSSGFHMYVTNYTSATVFSRSGIQIYPSVKDTNGNFFSTDANGNVIDTLGRTPVTKTVNGSQTYFDVLNSQGSTSRYTVTTTTINVNTSFGQSGVTEYSGTLTVISSISFPDSTSYSFTYDSGSTGAHYGELTGVTQRTGGTVTYGYSNFSDAYGNINQWVTSRVFGGGTWTYAQQVLTTCAPGATGCTQQVTKTQPSNDQQVLTFNLNNGSWNTQTLTYNGSSATGTLLSTVTVDYDFTNACTLVGCFGDTYIRPIRHTLIDPIPGSSLSKKTEFTYDSISNGNVTVTKEWKYYTGTPSSTPDRQITMTYLTTSSYVSKDIRDRLTQRTGDGGTVTNSYDSTTLTSVTGVTNHDDTNFGTSDTVRGNLTQVSTVVARGKANLITTVAFDTTGQAIKATDSNSNATSYSYSDSFATDNNANPPSSYTPATPTNAYVTSKTFANNQTWQQQYYFNTGRIASIADENSQTRYNHYIDSLDRQTAAWTRPVSGTSNRGWKVYAYPSATQVNTTTAITSTSPTGCTSCRQDSVTYDTLGRQTRSTLVSDPDGQTFTDITYDSSNRKHSDSNPYRTTSDPTYGLNTYAYDGMNRLTSTTHADGNVSSTYMGAAVGSNGGASSQLCASSTYGLGYPTLTVDEAGKKSQSWVDGLGRTIETDEPDSSNNLTLATCYQYNLQDQVTQIVQGSQTRARSYDAVPRITSSTDPESGTTQYFYLTTSLIQCSGNSSNICYQTDARGVTTTFTYDSRSRLTSKTYSDTTPTETYYFDQTSYNSLTITNGAGRMTGMNDGSGQTAWSYDGEGNKLAEQQTISGVTKGTTYTYNLDNSVATMTYPSGMVVTYAYNNAQRTTSATDTTNPSTPVNYVSSATYAPQGYPASAVYGLVSGGFAGITESFTYNNRLQPVNHIASSSAGTALSHTYSFNLGSGVNNGSIASITNNLDTGRTQTFTYDNMNRLATAQSQATSGADCWGQSYGYDRYGNLTTTNVTQCTAPSLSLTVNSSNNQITNTGVTYDAAGNMTNDGTQAYTWDGAGRLKSAGGIANVFDGNYLRVSQGSSQLYWYKVASCGHELMGRSGSTGNYDTEFIYFNGSQVAYKDDTGAHVYYYFNDHLGSARVMTDSSGVTQFDSDYFPFGGQRSVVSNEDSPLKFNGKWRDSTGVDNSYRRFYDPALGRWLSPDPVPGRLGQPATNDLYAYVGDQPVNQMDPNGTFMVGFICVPPIIVRLPCPLQPLPARPAVACMYWTILLATGDICDRRYAAAALPACLALARANAAFYGLGCFGRCFIPCQTFTDRVCKAKFAKLAQCTQRTNCRLGFTGGCGLFCLQYAIPRFFIFPGFCFGPGGCDPDDPFCGDPFGDF